MKTTAILGLCLMILGFGCAGDNDSIAEAPLERATAALRPLGPNELVGTLSNNGTVVVNYPATAIVQYRALSFRANVGDRVKVHVNVSPGAVVVGAIVDASGVVIAPWAVRSTSLDLEGVMPASGEYRIVLRERALRAATFQVSLAIQVPTADGGPCMSPAECSSGRCTNPGDNGPRGVCGRPQPNGATCTAARDCQSAACTQGVCAAPSTPVRFDVPSSLRGQEVTALTDCGWALTLKFDVAAAAPAETQVRAIECEFGWICSELFDIPKRPIWASRAPSFSNGGSAWSALRESDPSFVGSCQGNYSATLTVEPSGGALQVTARRTFVRAACASQTVRPSYDETCHASIPF